MGFHFEEREKQELDIHPHHLPPVPLFYSERERTEDNDEDKKAIVTGTAVIKYNNHCVASSLF